LLLKKPDRLRRRRGGQPDQEGVEVVQHLPPQVVDGPVALVDHDEVERLDRDALVEDDRHGLLDEGRLRLESRMLLVGLVELLVAFEDGIEALDGRDDHLARRGDGVGGELLDVVLVGELVAVDRADELLERLVGLPSEVGAIHEEQDALRPAELYEPIAGVHGGQRLAAAGRHLDQRPGAVLGERLLQVLDRPPLDRPELRGEKRRQVFQLIPHLLRGAEQGEPKQFVGSVEGEDLAAAGVGFEQIRELRDRPGALVGERQRAAVGRDAGRQRPGVLRRLRLDPDERMPLRLGLDDPDRLPGDVEQVIRLPGQHRELADRDPRPRRDVHRRPVLDVPPALFELAVDVLPRLIFGVHSESPRGPQ
jgi:hypothetical protein